MPYNMYVLTIFKKSDLDSTTLNIVTKIKPILLTEEEFFESLVAYEFGLFGNVGTGGNSSLYPDQYTVGKQSFPNRGCTHGENVRQILTNVNNILQ